MLLTRMEIQQNVHPDQMQTQEQGWKHPSLVFSDNWKYIKKGLPWWLRWYRICLQCRRPGFNPWFGKIPWRRNWQHTPVFSPGKSHGPRSLVGYYPWGRKELDTAEQLHFHFHRTDETVGSFNMGETLTVLREIYHSQKDKYCTVLLTWGTKHGQIHTE